MIYCEGESRAGRKFANYVFQDLSCSYSQELDNLENAFSTFHLRTPRQNAVVISYFCGCVADVYGEFSREGYFGQFCQLCAAGFSKPKAIKVYFLANYRPHLSHVWTNVISAIPNFLFVHLPYKAF